MSLITSKNRTIFLLVIILVIFAISFMQYQTSTRVIQSDSIVLLIPDAASLNEPVITAWTNTAQELGVKLMVMRDKEYLRSDWSKKNYVGIILPDSVHRIISPALLGQLHTYLQSGGNLMIVYDAATQSKQHQYFMAGPPFSSDIGIKYVLYNELQDKFVAADSVGNKAGFLASLGIPYGKAMESEKVNVNSAIIPDDSFAWIGGYQHSTKKLAHFVTQGKYHGQTILQTPDGQLIAGLTEQQNGKILFVNLPLGFYCVQTDCLLQQVFLRYFAQDVSNQPIMSMVPRGIGGLIANLHIDGNLDIDPFDVLKKIGFFDQGPFSIDFTAGPDVYYPGDGAGMNLSNNKKAQEWIKYFIKKNYTVGDHGGWIHNYFGLNIDETNAHKFEKYLELNDEVISKITRQKTLEYSAPVGTETTWSLEWLEKNGFLAHYTTGNTGAAPTHIFTNGKLEFKKIWAFPITPLFSAASFEDFASESYSQKMVGEWLNLLSNYVVDRHTVHLFYFHAHGVHYYLDAISAWIKTTKKLTDMGGFHWYTMSEIAKFLDQKEKVQWYVQHDRNIMQVSASHPDSLKDQTWLILKKSCDRPLVERGDASISADALYWIVASDGGKSLKFSCILPAPAMTTVNHSAKEQTVSPRSHYIMTSISTHYVSAPAALVPASLVINVKGGAVVAGAPGAPGLPGPPGPPGPPAPGARGNLQTINLPGVAPLGVGGAVNYPSGFFELGGFYANLTNNYGNWVGEYARTTVQTSQKNIWFAEATHGQEFFSEDTLGVVGNIHNFTDDFYTFVSGGGSGDGFIFPRYESNVFVNKKWLSDSSLITTLGYNMYSYRNSAYTNNGFVGLIYYFQSWIGECGYNLYQNQPGSVWGATQFISLTQGENKHHYITLRYEFGREAYQPVGQNLVLTNFPYKLPAIIWRQWVGKDWGFNLRTEYFMSQPYYRSGVWLGLFRDF